MSMSKGKKNRQGASAPLAVPVEQIPPTTIGVPSKETAMVEKDGEVAAGNEKKKKKRKREKEAGAEAEISTAQVAAKDEGENGDAEEEEVEVISHKEARKRRKLEAKLAKAGKQAPTVPEDPEEPAAAPAKAESTAETIFTTNKRSPYGVWVGNLHFSTVPQQLVHFLNECGTITRCHMPAGRKPGEANKGFAYVDFDALEGAEGAVKLSEGHLDGRRLLIKLASDFTGRPSAASRSGTLETSEATGQVASGSGVSKTARKILDGQKQPAGPCLYLGNLSFSATEDGIREMFEAHHRAASTWKPKQTAPRSKAKEDESGSDAEPEDPSGKLQQAIGDDVGIRQVRVGTFEDSGRCKGWAFVDFHHIHHATAALINRRNHTLDGRNLVIEYASPDAVRRGGGRASTHEGRNARKERADRHDRSATQKEAPLSEGERAEDVEATSDLAHVALEAAERAERPLKVKRDVKGKRRQSSGAALANAPRAKTAIVQGGNSTGKKVVFE